MVNLSHNDIAEIASFALHQSSIFSTLDLSFNRLSSLTGYGLVRLMRLDASHNQLNAVAADTFNGLHQTFQQLNLAHNNLTTFHAGQLFHHQTFQQLNLAHNNLTTFHASQLFHQTNALHTLHLSQSLFHLSTPRSSRKRTSSVW